MVIKLKLLNLYIKGCRLLLGVKKDKVFFLSFNGKSYSDNPRAISEKLHSILPDVQIVWGFDEPEKKKDVVPFYVKCIKHKNSFCYYRELATSAVYISNFGIPNIPKSKKQMFIQTWHGDRAFKKILYDAGRKRTVAESIDNYCDYAIAGSKYGERQYRSAFGYNGGIVTRGTPRNDCLISQSDAKIDEIKRMLNIRNDVKILLYAPTLRDTVAKNEYQKIQEIDLKETLNLLEKKYSSEWICFVRAHAAVGGLWGVELSDKIRDVSSYEDMADLLLISDMLITDYSSCAGDFALLKRPLVLFQSDRKEYEEKDRGFYFRMEDSPYYIAESQEELEKIISGFDEEKIKKNCEDILSFYGTNETGKAAETVANLIVEHIANL